ncbi:hypothetical protein IFM89_020591 [Coptis chinensis]|uniref:SHSP domain-containing protein n=1 Tax=Coptis chinensis TaxID=261450 RepID=A0A835ISC4_9MAGN|nr:hypothetical protein IFM89_020591 [Coptis chinensis]
MAFPANNGDAQGQVTEATADDQRFLANFITGNYLGPDVLSDVPRRSILQRVEEGLPQYECTDLGSSFLLLHQMECLYGFILKNARPSALLKDTPLQQYFNNKLHFPKSGLVNDVRQFRHFFPAERHAQEIRGRNSKMFQGIVLIDNPDTSHIKPDAFKRFKLLSGRNEVKIDKEEFESYCLTKQIVRDEKNRKRRKDHANANAICWSEPLQIMRPVNVAPLSICYPDITNWADTRKVDELDGPSPMRPPTHTVHQGSPDTGKATDMGGIHTTKVEPDVPEAAHTGKAIESDIPSAMRPPSQMRPRHNSMVYPGFPDGTADIGIPISVAPLSTCYPDNWAHVGKAENGPSKMRPPKHRVDLDFPDWVYTGKATDRGGVHTRKVDPSFPEWAETRKANELYHPYYTMRPPSKMRPMHNSKVDPSFPAGSAGSGKPNELNAPSTLRPMQTSKADPSFPDWADTRKDTDMGSPSTVRLMNASKHRLDSGFPKTYAEKTTNISDSSTTRLTHRSMVLDSVCTLAPSIVYSGTAREWRIGPSIGQLDIGISDDAYFFRVSLPGVEKDAGKLSCEVERCGKINLKGFTKTGEQFILRRSRLFKMKTKSLAPRGEFTISFDLPGQVDPRSFECEFKDDGLFEAVVLKHN